MNTNEMIFSLQNELKTLEDQSSRIKAAISLLEGLNAHKVSPVIQTVTKEDDTCYGRVSSFLKNSTRTVSLTEIHDSLGFSKPNIHIQLTRLMKEGKVMKVGWGLYAKSNTSGVMAAKF